MKRPIYSRDGHKYEISTAFDSQPAGEPIRIGDRTTGRNFLRALLADRVNIIVLRELLAHETSTARTIVLTDREVVEQLAWRLASGRLRVYLESRPHYEGSGHRRQESRKATGETATAEEDVAETAAPADAVPTTGWISFRIVDDDTGEPMPGVGLKLRLPDGTTQSYTSESDGTINLFDLAHGPCDILEMTDSEALEIVSMA